MMSSSIVMLILLAELALLYLLSRSITQRLYTLLRIITRSRRVAVALLSFILLPGTVVHELAHLLVAEVLRVPTGRISFTPRTESLKNGSIEVHAATVQIGRTDPFRRYLVGFAPVFVGLAVLVLIAHVARIHVPPLAPLRLQLAAAGLTAYLAYAVSNTMFSSRRDLAGFVVFAPIIVIIAAAIWVVGIRIQLTPERAAQALRAGQELAKILGAVIVLNVLVYLSARLLGRTVSDNI